MRTASSEKADTATELFPTMRRVTASHLALQCMVGLEEASPEVPLLHTEARIRTLIGRSQICHWASVCSDSQETGPGRGAIVACFPSSSLVPREIHHESTSHPTSTPSWILFKNEHPVRVEGIPESFSKIYEVKIILLILPIDFFMSFPPSGDSMGYKNQVMDHNSPNAEANLLIYLTSMKPDVRGVFKNIKQCHASMNLAWKNVVLSENALYMLPYNGLVFN